MGNRKWGIEYVEIDVNAGVPRMQKTLLRLGFHPVGYVPALAVHDVERFGVVKMVRLNVSAATHDAALVPQAKLFADLVIAALERRTAGRGGGSADRHVSWHVGRAE